MRDIIQKFIDYLTLRSDKEAKGFVKQMHIINKISIFIFLIGIIVLINRCM